MKILHIDDERWDSGLTEYALALAKAQKLHGNDIQFWGRKNAFPIKKASEYGIKTAACCNWPLRLFSLRSMIIKFNPDIINAHTGSSHSMAVMLCCGMKNPPAIIRTRTDFRAMTAKPMSAQLWKHTRGFVAANTEILGNFRHVFSNSNIPAEVIYQGAEDAKIGTPSKPKTGACPTIGMAARLDPVKGHETALKAAAKICGELPMAVFRFAGEEKNIKTEVLLKTASDLGISKNVRFEGYVADIDLFMKSCDLGIIPSVSSEAVSRAAVEWLRAGVPCVCSSTGCLPEIIKNNLTGLIVPPSDHTALAEAVLTILKNPQQLVFMGQSARNRYESKFTAKKFVDETMNLYAKAIRNIPS